MNTIHIDSEGNHVVFNGSRANRFYLVCTLVLFTLLTAGCAVLGWQYVELTQKLHEKTTMVEVLSETVRVKQAEIERLEGELKASLKKTAFIQARLDGALMPENTWNEVFQARVAEPTARGAKQVSEFAANSWDATKQAAANGWDASKQLAQRGWAALSNNF